MKKPTLIIVLAFFFSICLFSQEKTANQALQYKTESQADWPANLDAFIAVPDNHKILMENEKVWVLEVTLALGDTEEVHHHR